MFMSMLCVGGSIRSLRAAESGREGGAGDSRIYRVVSFVGWAWYCVRRSAGVSLESHMWSVPQSYLS